jgi:N-carbamoyl-L-amino-acid hydrolase
LRINGARLRSALDTVNQVGFVPGHGRTRLALSDADRDARNLLVGWLKDLGLEVVVDDVGNIFGKRRGHDDRLPPVLVGSHIDTVKRGGQYDGVLGVMAALEVIRSLEDHGIETDRPIWVVNWCEEEGTRFPPGLVGSAVWSGLRTPDWAYGLTDSAGLRFGDELGRIGYRGETPAAACPVHAYLEVHVDQGVVLEQSGKTIGVPKGIVGLRFATMHVEGRADHAGGMQMVQRHDALCAAAEMILQVNALPNRFGADMVTTVGEMHVRPNSRFTVPASVDFAVDIRCWDDDLALRAWEELNEFCEAAARRRICQVSGETLLFTGRLPFDQSLTSMVEATARELGHTTHPMASGASHDAANLCQIAPTAMILVPLIGGRSHVPEEETSWYDCEAGANVLLQCVLKSGAAVS